MAPGVGQAQKALVDEGKEEQAVGISGAPAAPQNVLSSEERIEYRDQDGNLLDPEIVKELEGEVEFQTRYETRIRVVDPLGNEIPEPVGGWPQNMQEIPVAPPHPDVEGADKSTKLVPDDSVPQDEAVPVFESEEGAKEAQAREPRHVSKLNEASSKDEEPVHGAAA